MEKKLKYKKENINLVVVVSNAETGDPLFKIPNRNAVNINEVFSDHHIDSILKKNYSIEELPKSVTVMAYGIFDLNEI